MLSDALSKTQHKNIASQSRYHMENLYKPEVPRLWAVKDESPQQAHATVFMWLSSWGIKAPVQL